MWPVSSGDQTALQFNTAGEKFPNEDECIMPDVPPVDNNNQTRASNPMPVGPFERLSPTHGPSDPPAHDCSRTSTPPRTPPRQVLQDGTQHRAYALSPVSPSPSPYMRSLGPSRATPYSVSLFQNGDATNTQSPLYPTDYATCDPNDAYPTDHATWDPFDVPHNCSDRDGTNSSDFCATTEVTGYFVDAVPQPGIKDSRPSPPHGIASIKQTPQMGHSQETNTTCSVAAVDTDSHARTPVTEDKTTSTLPDSCDDADDPDTGAFSVSVATGDPTTSQDTDNCAETDGQTEREKRILQMEEEVIKAWSPTWNPAEETDNERSAGDPSDTEDDTESESSTENTDNDDKASLVDTVFHFILNGTNAQSLPTNKCKLGQWTKAMRMKRVPRQSWYGSLVKLFEGSHLLEGSRGTHTSAFCLGQGSHGQVLRFVATFPSLVLGITSIPAPSIIKSYSVVVVWCPHLCDEGPYTVGTGWRLLIVETKNRTQCLAAEHERNIRSANPMPTIQELTFLLTHERLSLGIYMPSMRSGTTKGKSIKQRVNECKQTRRKRSKPDGVVIDTETVLCVAYYHTLAKHLTDPKFKWVVDKLNNTHMSHEGDECDIVAIVLQRVLYMGVAARVVVMPRYMVPMDPMIEYSTRIDSQSQIHDVHDVLDGLLDAVQHDTPFMTHFRVQYNQTDEKTWAKPNDNTNKDCRAALDQIIRHTPMVQLDGPTIPMGCVIVWVTLGERVRAIADPVVHGVTVRRPATEYRSKQLVYLECHATEQGIEFKWTPRMDGIDTQEQIDFAEHLHQFGEHMQHTSVVMECLGDIIQQRMEQGVTFV